MTDGHAFSVRRERSTGTPLAIAYSHEGWGLVATESRAPLRGHQRDAARALTPA